MADMRYEDLKVIDVKSKAVSYTHLYELGISTPIAR